MSKQPDRQTFDEVMVPNYAPEEIIPVRGKGSRIWDQTEREYIDFAGGIAVNVLGHCHPKLVSALEEQGNRLWHLSNVWTNEPALRLAQQLCAKTFADRVYFANSGAEANEAAFKLARKYAYDNFGPDKYEIISCENSFHGRTLFTVSVGGQPKYREGFEPTPRGIRHVPFNSIRSLEEQISERACALVLEPIQGEGGIIPIEEDYLRAARELCDQHNALLILDEIQTGIGRTGKLFAYQHSTITPDILTTAKALGGGFPIGAMLCREKIAESFGIGTHGSTYGGNPLACHIAGTVLELIDQPSMYAGVMERNQLFLDALDYVNQRFPVFRQIRGQGLLLGCEMQPDYQGKARQLLKIALQKGIMVLIAGPNVIRLAPSLIIPEEDIQTGVERLGLAMEQFLLEC